jgi:hypothetical protein
MAKLNVGVGSTNRSEYIYIIDSLSSTGLGKTGISYNTSGLNAHYVRNAGSATTISLASQTATGSWTSGGWAEVDGIRMPGLYRVDLPNAIFSSGSDKAIVYIKGVSNTIPVTLEYQLTLSDPNTFSNASIGSSVWNYMTQAGITADELITMTSNELDLLVEEVGNVAQTVWDYVLTNTKSAEENLVNIASGGTAISAYDVWNYASRTITAGNGSTQPLIFPENFEYMLITKTGRVYINKADIERIKT